MDNLTAGYPDMKVDAVRSESAILLSACMLTLNEADHIVLSVPPLLEIVDELVVIDGGSQDATVELLRSYGDKVRVHVIPQGGKAYSGEWKQEQRREHLQELCAGRWIFQVDADEVLGKGFEAIREEVEKASDDVICFGVWRMDYAPDLYHAFQPYKAHPSIPRIWRRNEVTWLTGKALHMIPYRTGTQQPISTFPEPIFKKTDLLLHHLHRAYWIGKSSHKIRADEAKRPPLSRLAKIAGYSFEIAEVPSELLPETIGNLRRKQKQALLAGLSGEDILPTQSVGPTTGTLAGLEPKAAQIQLDRLIRALPNPILFVHAGNASASLTHFLALQTGGCVVVQSHWKDFADRAEYFKGVAGQADKIIVTDSASRVRQDLKNVDLLFIEGLNDLLPILQDWSPCLSQHALICGQGANQEDLAKLETLKPSDANQHFVMHHEGELWWLERVTNNRKMETFQPNIGSKLEAPHLRESELSFLKEVFSTQSRCYLEFGLGESTLMAVRAGFERIIALDSDPQRVRDVSEHPEVSKSIAEGRTQILHADIGPVGIWGNPDGEKHKADWPHYLRTAWDACAKARIRPDLVYVDGRFRVACCLSVLLAALGRDENLIPIRVLIHDMGPARPNYLPILKYFDVIRTERTLALLQAKRGNFGPELVADLLRYQFEAG
ncbi:MAG: hypothetical protein DI532_02470 [Azospirillum brasilense]|nr:MAG: hypothetical protein DI532_02470 [Azospirillum brasilense]